jgi:hypothetical protein
VRRNGPQSPWAGLVFSRAGSTVAGLNFGEADELRYHWNGSSQTWGWDSGLIVPDDTWTFVALVVEPDRAQLAMSVGTTLLTTENLVNHATEAFDGNLEFARDSGFSNRWFDGSLDDVRLYDVALSLVELQQLLDDAH